MPNLISKLLQMGRKTESPETPEIPEATPCLIIHTHLEFPPKLQNLVASHLQGGKPVAILGSNPEGMLLQNHPTPSPLQLPGSPEKLLQPNPEDSLEEIATFWLALLKGNPTTQDAFQKNLAKSLLVQEIRNHPTRSLPEYLNQITDQLETQTDQIDPVTKSTAQAIFHKLQQKLNELEYLLKNTPQGNLPLLQTQQEPNEMEARLFLAALAHAGLENPNTTQDLLLILLNINPNDSVPIFQTSKFTGIQPILLTHTLPTSQVLDFTQLVFQKEENWTSSLRWG